MSLQIGLSGALGRMGAAVGAVIGETADMTLRVVFDRPETQSSTAMGLPLTDLDAALRQCGVVIDFSTPAAGVTLAAKAAGAGGPALVIGATGFSAEQDAAVAEASKHIAIVKAGNYAIGVNILAGVVEETARRLGPELWDIEVFEAHHRRKVDAPSGTALMLAHAAARGRGRSLADLRTPQREGVTGQRALGSIGMSVMRGGGIIGEHSVVFAADEETLTFSHTAMDRGLFARGAVAAARWVAGRPPGLYDMMDVLGFRGVNPT